MDNFNDNIVEQTNKLTKRKVKVLTMVKKKKNNKMSIDNIVTIAHSLTELEPNKRMMIKCLTQNGYFTMKAYDDDISVIQDEDQYLRGREKNDTMKSDIYKVSFYLM